MTQEDQTQNFQKKSSRRPKQKKVPQRGLGVAQLERIRVQEQQMKDAAIAYPSVLPSSPSSAISSSQFSYLPLPIPNFHHYNQPSSPSPISLPCGSSLSPQNIDLKVSSPASVQGHGILPKLWSSPEFDFEKDVLKVDPGLTFLSNLPYESNSNSIWPHQQPHCSPMVNVSSEISSTSSVQYLMEPPSNQNYNGNCVPLQLKNKIIGMKRPYPFSLDVPPSPFNFRTFAAPMNINETASCGSGSGFNCAGNSTFREAPSSSTSNSQPNPKRSNKENQNFNKNFLTLALPSPTSSCPPSNFKSPSSFLASHNQEYPHLESQSFQGIIEEQFPPMPGFSRFNQQQQQHQPFYNFFPQVPKAAQTQIGPTTPKIQNFNDELGENLDLNLKL